MFLWLVYFLLRSNIYECIQVICVQLSEDSQSDYIPDGDFKAAPRKPTTEPLRVTPPAPARAAILLPPSRRLAVLALELYMNQGRTACALSGLASFTQHICEIHAHCCL